MTLTEFKIPEVKLISCKVYGDPRGFFTERFRQDFFNEIGLSKPFVQENFSRSSSSVLRGLHFQYNLPQGKLITCISGSIYDVAMDVRANSPTFGQHIAVELDGNQPQWFWIPPGFAHGFCVTSKQSADVYYKVDNYYNIKGEEGLIWNDPDAAIPWPVKSPVLSPKDTQLQSLKQYKINPRFLYQENIL